MSDSTMLLAVFEEIEPAVNGIEKLQELGVSDEQMNIISGIPIKETILGRPSALSYVSRIAMVGAILGMLFGIFLIYRDSLSISIACRRSADLPCASRSYHYL